MRTERKTIIGIPSAAGALCAALTCASLTAFGLSLDGNDWKLSFRPQHPFLTILVQSVWCGCFGICN